MRSNKIKYRKNIYRGFRVQDNYLQGRAHALSETEENKDLRVMNIQDDHNVNEEEEEEEENDGSEQEAELSDFECAQVIAHDCCKEDLVTMEPLDKYHFHWQMGNSNTYCYNISTLISIAKSHETPEFREPPSFLEPMTPSTIEKLELVLQKHGIPTISNVLRGATPRNMTIHNTQRISNLLSGYYDRRLLAPGDVYVCPICFAMTYKDMGLSKITHSINPMKVLTYYGFRNRDDFQGATDMSFTFLNELRNHVQVVHRITFVKEFQKELNAWFSEWRLRASGGLIQKYLTFVNKSITYEAKMGTRTEKFEGRYQPSRYWSSGDHREAFLYLLDCVEAREHHYAAFPLQQLFQESYDEWIELTAGLYEPENEDDNDAIRSDGELRESDYESDYKEHLEVERKEELSKKKAKKRRGRKLSDEERAAKLQRSREKDLDNLRDDTDESEEEFLANESDDSIIDCTKTPEPISSSDSDSDSDSNATSPNKKIIHRHKRSSRNHKASNSEEDSNSDSDLEEDSYSDSDSEEERKEALSRKKPLSCKRLRRTIIPDSDLEDSE